MSQPALSLASQLLRRAARAGAPAELAELDAGDEKVSDLGHQLLALVVQAQAAGLDPELELRAAARAYDKRVRDWESTGT